VLPATCNYCPKVAVAKVAVVKLGFAEIFEKILSTFDKISKYFRCWCDFYSLMGPIYEGRNLQVHTPKNCQSVHLVFRAEKIAKTVGSLASMCPKDGRHISGVLVQKDFSHTIMAPEELSTYTQLKTNTIIQRQTIPFHLPFASLHHSLEQMYEGVEVIVPQDSSDHNNSNNNKDNSPATGTGTGGGGGASDNNTDHDDTKENPKSKAITLLRIYDSLTILYYSTHVTLEWTANPVNDMIADSALAVILQLEANPKAPSSPSSSPSASSSPHAHPHAHSHTAHSHHHHHHDDTEKTEDISGTNNLDPKWRQIRKILTAQFGHVEVDADNDTINIALDTARAIIDMKTLTVEATTIQLQERVAQSMQHICATVFPIPNP